MNFALYYFICFAKSPLVLIRRYDNYGRSQFIFKVDRRVQESGHPCLRRTAKNLLSINSIKAVHICIIEIVSKYN